MQKKKYAKTKLEQMSFISIWRCWKTHLTSLGFFAQTDGNDAWLCVCVFVHILANLSLYQPDSRSRTTQTNNDDSHAGKLINSKRKNCFFVSHLNILHTHKVQIMRATTWWIDQHNWLILIKLFIESSERKNIRQSVLNESSTVRRCHGMRTSVIKRKLKMATTVAAIVQHSLHDITAWRCNYVH